MFRIPADVRFKMPATLTFLAVGFGNLDNQFFEIMFPRRSQTRVISPTGTSKVPTDSRFRRKLRNI